MAVSSGRSGLCLGYQGCPINRAFACNTLDSMRLEGKESSTVNHTFLGALPHRHPSAGAINFNKLEGQGFEGILEFTALPRVDG